MERRTENKERTVRQTFFKHFRFYPFIQTQTPFSISTSIICVFSWFYIFLKDSSGKERRVKLKSEGKLKMTYERD